MNFLRPIGLSTIITLAFLAGCASEPEPIVDAVATAKNKNMDVRDRNRAIDQMWAEGGTGPTRQHTRETLKNIVWGPNNGPSVRNHAMDVLLADPADTDHADTRKSLKLMLQTEKDYDVVAHISEIATKENWTDFTPPLMRQFARNDWTMESDKRPEHTAILALNPGKTIEQIAFEVFAAPVTVKGIEGEQLQKCRDFAWEVLSKADPSGAFRREKLTTMSPEPGDVTVTDVQVCLREFRCIPLTASQLQWLRRMRTPGDKAKATWWQNAANAVATLDESKMKGFTLRHVEPVRWSAANRPDWLRLSREELLAQLAERLRGREQFGRSGAYSGGTNDTLEYHADKMCWGDVLAVIVVDESLKTKSIGDVAWNQAMRDMKDTSTEYGGLLVANDALGIPADNNAPFTLALYPPRATQRFGDTRFVASDDMLSHGAVALANYHYHAQRVDNADFAGPGPGDMEYAFDQGVTCLVLTPVKEGVQNADVYMAGGIRLDLGPLKK
ncbi:MAG: hypothetical protein ACREJO_16670 [Phycisphaerales bacterium]